MKPRLDPNLFTITVVLATLIHLPALQSQETQPYDTCGQSVKCGDIDFEYPFWGSGRPAYCGHPDFRLTCQSNASVLVLDSVNYRVLVNPDTSTHTITIARNDLWSNNCPQYLHNTSYDSTLFNGNNFGQEDVSLYYGCQDLIPGGIPAIANYRFDCDANGTGRSDSYFFRTSYIVPEFENSLVRCNNSIIVPVDGSRVNGLASVNDLSSALRAGFNLQWRANNEECEQCIKSDGRCGSNSTSPELFACYCATGNFSLTCNNTNVNGGGGSKSSSMGIVLGIVGAGIVVVGVGCGIFVCQRRRKRRAIIEASPAHTETKAILTAAGSSQGLTSYTTNSTSSIPSYPSSKTSDTSKEFGKSTYFGAQVFTYEELDVATDNFNDSRELGDGGFGTVYFGKLLDGREVAVKRLYENNFKRVEQFINEVRILTGLDHENLLISSLPAVDTSRHRLDINLANMAVTKIQNHMLEELVDKSIGFETNGLVRRMTTLVAELAFRCLQHEKDMRPTMKEVVETLKGIQNDEFNAQKPEVLDILVDDGSLMKDHNTEPASPDSGITSVNASSDLRSALTDAFCSQPDMIMNSPMSLPSFDNRIQRNYKEAYNRHFMQLHRNYVPVFCDSLSKIEKESIVSVMGARGTAGYMAPEVFFRSLGGASHKSDVYSYGMMVLEMTGARKHNNAKRTSTSEEYFPDWIYKQVEVGGNLGDNGVTTEEEDRLARKMMMMVSLWCIQPNPLDRPSISKVVEMLEGSFESLQVPPRHFESSPARPFQSTLTSFMQSSSDERVSTGQGNISLKKPASEIA
ncbi:hypothetical protein L1987_51432 [Smallanthus sonchifolius]|uniref:Uncharacterized protein n=1 Tax=Smallanthus sonchifolius TaxID=185202 RepID=A0ACB9EQB1_9ASTR|nr:hypothetical protein L1987_51432 [Smallanthus sonchifolius]